MKLTIHFLLLLFFTTVYLLTFFLGVGWCGGGLQLRVIFFTAQLSCTCNFQFLQIWNWARRRQVCLSTFL